MNFCTSVKYLLFLGRWMKKSLFKIVPLFRQLIFKNNVACHFQYNRSDEYTNRGVEKFSSTTFCCSLSVHQYSLLGL